MNIDLEQLQEKLCSFMCADIRLLERKGRVLITTPFVFPDGDSYVLYLDEMPSGLLRISDAGHTMMHMSYENDVDKYRQGTRGKLFEQVIANGQVKEIDGEIFLETSPEEIGSAIFRLSQTITSITDLNFLNRARAESTFYEDLGDLLAGIVDSEILEKNYIYTLMDNAEDYPIDYKIKGKVDPLYVFGIPNRDKARLATIILERLLRANAQFESVLIFADQSTMPRADLARLSNVGGEMVASLDAGEDAKRKIERRAEAA